MNPAASVTKPRWTAAQVACLRDLIAAGASQDELTSTLGRTMDAIRFKASAIGAGAICGKDWRGWTEAEVARLRDLEASGMPGPDIAAVMGRSRDSVGSMSARLGIRRPRKARQPHHPQPIPVPWSEEQLVRLIDLRKTGASFDDIASVTGHTPKGVKTKASRIGLSRRAESRAPDETAARRRCAKCEKPFWAATKFVRRCETCHADD